MKVALEESASSSVIFFFSASSTYHFSCDLYNLWYFATSCNKLIVVPTCTTFPSFKTTILSASFTEPSLWVTITAVLSLEISAKRL